MKRDDIKDLIITEMHKEWGYCGHCGKKECGGKASYSKLPQDKFIGTMILILERVFSKLED